MYEDQHQDQGSFLTGFTVGLLAGAASYFLFATDRGEQVRKDLLKEWAEARATMPGTDGQSVPPEEMKGWLKNVVLGVAEAFRPPVDTSKTKKPRSKKSK